MASGRNARPEGRWFVSPWRITTTLLIIFSIGFLVLWMETYSSILPVRKVSSSQNKSNEKQLENQTEYQTPEDSGRDLPDEAMAVDTNFDSSLDDKNPSIWENGDTSKPKPKYNGDEEAKNGETKTEDEESNTGFEDTKADDGREITGKDESAERSNDGKQDNESLEKDSSSIGDEKKGDKESYPVSNDALPDVMHSEILDEANTTNGAWSTQDLESRNAKEAQQSSDIKNGTIYGYSWKICNVSAGPDYIPCLDNVEAIRKLRSTKHYEHRERHCPDEAPTCLVSLPEGYKLPIKWPTSRDKVWYNNVPHTKLAEVKGSQNWMRVSGEYITFPGGGTQFKHGALHYIEFLQDSVPDIAWGNRTRVILDVGCGVASFGGYLFESDVLTMSLAPKDEHEAQVQLALERGIPAISAVMGTKRLPFPSMVFDIIHCARCRVPWHIEGGKLLLELNRLLRPGGYFVWSATPVYSKKLEEDVAIWKAMSTLTKCMCWELMAIKKDNVNGVGAAIYRKPSSNECYKKRQKDEPPLCKESDDPNAAWNVPLQACMHKVPSDASERGSHWPVQWPKRLEKPPYWLKSSQPGAYGKSAPDDFSADYEHWKRVVHNSYLNGIGIKWSSVRNVMDMRSVYGGFAAALKDLKVWVMNVVPIDSPDTLPIIYERGLFGMYHDWCESFSTYPRSYDLLHADHLFSTVKKRCNLQAVIAEVDRILRPGGNLIVRDKADSVSEVENMVKSLHWEIHITYFKKNEGLLCAQKSMWRPKEVETIASAIE